jgi:UDP:flavonoid glycosyltransferase YjiC (YdhE family)
MAENSARVAWAGTGLMLPWRLLGAAPMRWGVRRILSGASFSARARELAEWSVANDGAESATHLVEDLV